MFVDAARRPRLAPVLLAPLYAVLFAADSLAAQATTEVDDERPRVEEVVFRGVESVDEGTLREGLSTQATRCRSLVFRPFCWVIDSGIFVDKRYLDREELARDELRVRVFYWLRGFRHVEVASDVRPEGEGVGITFTVDEGVPTTVNTVAVRQNGAVLDERQLAAAELPREGAPLNVIELDSAVVQLRAMLWERGFADAEVRDTVRPAGNERSVDVTIDVEPGARTTVKEIVVRGNEQVSERSILRLLELRPGRIFRPGDLLESQRRLYQSELFRQALITVPDQPDSAKRVVVTVREAPMRAVRAGIGANTVEFIQAEAGYTRYNWLGGTRRLDLRVATGNLLAPQLHDLSLFESAIPEGVSGEVEDVFLEPTWQISADLTQPWFFSTRNSLGLGAFAHRRSVPGIVIDRGYGANASFTRRIARQVPVSATYRFEQTRVEADEVYYCVSFGVCQRSTISALRGWQSLSPLGLSITADRTDDPLSPRGGFTARLDVEHASAVTASDFRYHRISGELARYLEVGRGVLAGRIRAGWVEPIESTARAVGVPTADALLHPRKRFYAGGARSVRGYGENQLGPRILTVPPAALLAADPRNACTEASIADGSCDPEGVPSSEFQLRPLGGNSLIEGSIEYRFPLWGQVGGAAFVDAAAVGDRDINIPSGARSAITPGFGVRYVSPVGPIRVDLGIRPTLTEDLPVVTQITGEDGASRIVQLRTRKSYDPVEDSGSFFDQVVNRLQLHLSIGEAF